MFICTHCPGGHCEDIEFTDAPDFCPSIGISAEEELARYNEEDKSAAHAAAIVEGRYYKQLTRVEEIMEYALQRGFDKIGLAFCSGLTAEGKIFVDILRANGFKVNAIQCKNGHVGKSAISIDPADFADKDVPEEIMCNPIGQAEKLDAAGCQLNVIMGLCVGHDTLFIQHSKAPVTVVAVKDRILGHNPLAAIYNANSYYSKLYHYVENRKTK